MTEQPQQQPSRNIDELKRLVISALDRNGVLSELRQTVKLHVTRAINEESPNIEHQKNEKISALLSTDRGQLLSELIVDFLRSYELNDTLSMFLVEGGLPKLRPSETEIATQCGFVYKQTGAQSVLEQLLTNQSELHLPQHQPVHHEYETHASAPAETSMEADMRELRRVSANIDEAYEDDFDESPTSPMVASRFTNPIDDNVLFESRDSFKDLGESPARLHPIDLNDHIENLN